MGLRTGRDSLLRTGATYVWMCLGAAVLATVAMERALLTHDFSLEYVADNHCRADPAALHDRLVVGPPRGLHPPVGAGPRRLRGGDGLPVPQTAATDRLVAWATLVALTVVAYFFALLVGPGQPVPHGRARCPLDGPGPNPLLQNHPLMLVHPPILYLGYVGFTIPFAFAIAALATGRLGEGWLIETRRWTLLA